ncbi:MAG: signal peptidase I [Chloroflexota bacterium]|nr:signal peptidase I [Chloroflexota bacterium]
MSRGARICAWLPAVAGASAATAGVGLAIWAIFGQRRAVVRGASMLPLLGPGEALLFDRLAYRLGRPARGDVVLVRATAPATPPVVKLLVGLPGEEMAVARDRLWIDGRELDLGRPVVGSSPGRWLLGPDDYFLLSVNLALGTDSRHGGPVPGRALLGRGWLVYAPAGRWRRLARPAVPLRWAGDGAS